MPDGERVRAVGVEVELGGALAGLGIGIGAPSASRIGRPFSQSPTRLDGPRTCGGPGARGRSTEYGGVSLAMRRPASIGMRSRVSRRALWLGCRRCACTVLVARRRRLACCRLQRRRHAGPITFGTIGPLVGDAGKGSWRFGAASAATQIEDMNPNTDWYAVHRSPTRRAGSATAPSSATRSKGYSKTIEDVGLVNELGARQLSVLDRVGAHRAAAGPDRRGRDRALPRASSTRCARWASARSSPCTTSATRSGSPIRATRAAPAGRRDTNLCGLGSPGGAHDRREMARARARCSRSASATSSTSGARSTSR